MSVDSILYILILPNYSTPRAFKVVQEFVTAMQKEVDFILKELATHISNNKPLQHPNNNIKSNNKPNQHATSIISSSFPNEFYQKQQIVDNNYYDLLEHFSYLCNNR